MGRQKKSKNVELGMRIAQLRKLNNMTQQELSELLGVTITSISGYENNHREPDIEALKKLSDIFKVSLDFLIAGESTIMDQRIYKLIEKLILKTNTKSILWENLLNINSSFLYLFEMKEYFLNNFFKIFNQLELEDIKELYVCSNKGYAYFLTKVNNKSSNITYTYLCIIELVESGFDPDFPYKDFKIIASDALLPDMENSNNLSWKASSNIQDLLTAVKSKEKGESDFIESLIESLDFDDE